MWLVLDVTTPSEGYSNAMRRKRTVHVSCSQSVSEQTVNSALAMTRSRIDCRRITIGGL